MRLVGGGFAALLVSPWIGGVVAHAASNPPPPSGDPRATSVSGNAVTCANAGFANDTQLGADNSSGNSGNGFTVTSDGQNLSVSTVPAGTTIDVLIVKGGDAYNVYPSGTFTTLPANGLHAPLVGNPPKNIPTISHWFLCYGPTQQQPQVTPPSADATGDCDVADFTLHAGSNPTDIVITRAGDLNGTTYSLGANGTLVVHVPLDSTHAAATATANGQTLKTFTRDNAVCDANNNGGGNNGGGNNGGGNNGGGNNGGGGGTSAGATVTNPAVSASNACKSGITVSLSNLGATAPVVFTLIAPDGTVSTESVGAGDSTTRSFAVAEDSTGVVKVSAPGLAPRTFTYDKDCVSVLGVKHTRHHTTHRTHQATQHEQAAVLGERAQRLPFTGFNSRRVAVDGALLIGLGVALCLVAGRRERSAS
jgi:hypothetical protein